MARDARRLEPGTLWRTITHRTQRAIECGSLHSIDTNEELLEQNGVQFVVRIVSNLARKDQLKKEQVGSSPAHERSDNPFLPYEEELYIADLSDTHLCLLNKFNVINHHLLIVTREFEHQESLLTLRDFEGLWACMAEFEGVGFYNGGIVAGASQPHKHLQMVPLPLSSNAPAIPIESVFESYDVRDDIAVLPRLPFKHAFTWLAPSLFEEPSYAAQITLNRYQQMIEAVGIRAIEVAGKLIQTAPYNLLTTRRWMLLVPRSTECFHAISVNALGFAGSLFVRGQEQKEIVSRYGPMTVLQHVTNARQLVTDSLRHSRSDLK